MAVVGQQLLQPEAGWKRYDNIDTMFSFNATPAIYTDTSCYNGSVYSVDTITFSFYGTGIRFIGLGHSSSGYRLTNIEVKIDGVKDNNFSQAIGGTIYQQLHYEKLNLEKKRHNVVITGNGADAGGWRVAFDAIDLIEFPEPKLAMTIKNPSTNQHYSLAEKTLIPLPDSSSKNMILHGIEAGKEIQLDEAFDKIYYVNDTPVVDVVDNSKVFTQKLEVRLNKLWIKEVK